VAEILSVTAGFLGKKGIPSPRLDAELLLGKVLDLPRVRLYISFERELSAGEVDLYRELVRRRSRREPAAYILGEKEFYSLPLKVTRATLIPRPETERLVDEALLFAKDALASPDGKGLSVCDVGTGCGAVAAALAANLPLAEVEASDVSPAALECARENLASLDLSRVLLALGDLLDAPFQARDFDLVCANLPYVPSSDIPGLPPDVRDYEPALALDGGEGGLELYLRLLPQAAARLRPRGALLCECQPDQFPALGREACRLGLMPRPPAEDLSGRDRIFSATKP
jgi:release factor glutamine methyltransferase